MRYLQIFSLLILKAAGRILLNKSHFKRLFLYFHNASKAQHCMRGIVLNNTCQISMQWLHLDIICSGCPRQAGLIVLQGK